MAEKRKARSLPTSLDVYSSVHKGKPCTACILCNEKQTQYTHPASWKNDETITLLRRLEPNKVIIGESCICRNCRDSLNTALKTPGNFQPRWRRENKAIDKCQVNQCTEKARRSTNIATWDRIKWYFNVITCNSWSTLPPHSLVWYSLLQLTQTAESPEL